MVKIIIKNYTNGSCVVELNDVKQLIRDLPELSQNKIEIDFTGIEMGLLDIFAEIVKQVSIKNSDNVLISGINYIESAHIKTLIKVKKGKKYSKKLWQDILKKEYEKTEEYRDELLKFPKIKKLDNDKSLFQEDNEVVKPTQEESIANGQCPECGSKLIYKEKCKSCSDDACAWSACG